MPNCKNPECSKEFEKTSHNKLYCSLECGYQYRYYGERLSTKTIQKCKNCGEEFVKGPKAHRKFYCSIECGMKFYNKRNRLPIRMRKCLWCQSPFRIRSSSHTFCGTPTCNQRYRKIKQRIYSIFPFEKEKAQKQLDRLDKLGKYYTFPKKHDSLNQLYQLKGKTEVIK